MSQESMVMCFRIVQHGALERRSKGAAQDVPYARLDVVSLRGRKKARADLAEL